MATLILAKSSKGRVTGRCDEKCYNGTGATCYCVCGGKNHGMGLVYAAKNTLAGIDFDITNLPRLPIGQRHVITVSPHVQHLASKPLFELYGEPTELFP